MDMDPQEQKKFIGSKLRDIRESRHMSLRQVAKACGVSYAQLGRIERGQFFPKLPEIYKLAKVYNVPRIDLLNTLDLSPGVDIKGAAKDKYKIVEAPLISACCKDPRNALLTTKKHFHVPAKTLPKNAFFVVSGDESADGIHPGSYVMVNPHYVWNSSDIYAVFLRHNGHSHILVGEVGKSIKFRDGDVTHRTGALITGTPGHYHWYFSTDYPRKDWKVLGHVDEVINTQPQKI